MKLARRNLPIGIQTFSQIISGGYYYADKTFFALALAQQDKYYFLSRPRRFGKSLFLDTLKELFEGQQDLFKGLYIADKWDWSQRFPVIRTSFGGKSPPLIQAAACTLQPNQVAQSPCEARQSPSSTMHAIPRRPCYTASSR